jgi:exonuclease III
LNIQGFSYIKILLLLEQENINILCLQETWISEGTAAPILEGFTLVKQCRPEGTRGGIVTYVRKPLKIESSSGNEYSLHTKIILPNN